MSHFRTAQNVALAMARMVLGASLALFTTAFLARILGPADNGVYAMAVLLPSMVVAISGLGLAPAAVYFISSGKFPLREVVAKNTIMSLIAAIAGVSASILLLNMYAELWFPGVPIHVLYLALLATFPLMMFGCLVAVFQGQQNFRLFGFFTLLPQSVAAICFVAVLWGVDNKVTVAVTIWSFAYVVALIAAIHHLRGAFSCFKSSASVRTDYIRSALKYGWKTHLGNLITLLNYRVDIYLLGAMVGAEAVGIYAVTVPMTEAVWLLSRAASTVIFPLVASRQSIGEDSNKITTVICRWVFLITLISAALLAGVSKQLVEILFGNAYAESGNVLLWLLPGVAVWSIARVLSNGIAGRGRPGINLALSTVTLMVNVFLNIALIPKFGVTGAAMASSISYSLFTLMVLNVYSRMTAVRIMEIIIPSRKDLTLLRPVLNDLRSIVMKIDSR